MGVVWILIINEPDLELLCHVFYLEDVVTLADHVQLVQFIRNVIAHGS